MGETQPAAELLRRTQMDPETVAKIRAEVSNPKPRWDEQNAYAKAQQAQFGQAIGGAIPMGYETMENTRARTKAENMIYEIAGRAKEGSELADRAQQALDFFEAKPAFAEFIALVRSGAIQF